MTASPSHRLGLTLAIFAAVWAITLPAPAQSPSSAGEVAMLRQKAEQGGAETQFYLGLMFAKGDGVPQDSEEAVKWFQKAAEQGLAEAQFYLGLMFAKGDGVSRDSMVAIKWFRKAAEQGNAEGQFLLGLKYDKGDGVPQDSQEAVKWYRKSAQQGDAMAQFNLGHMYANGTGVPKDSVEAVKWLRKSAEQGSVRAQGMLGQIYADGTSVPKDSVEAVKWFRKAAEQGSAEGEFLLGRMYAKGTGVPKNSVEAVKWFRKAAEQGHDRAQGMLGFMYANGTGIPQDYVQAHKWLNLSASQSGERVLIELRDDLARKMTPAQIAEAQKRAAEWNPTAGGAREPATTVTLVPGRPFRDCSDCPEMVTIPPGRFLMGSSEDEIAALIKEAPDSYAELLKSESPEHEVSIGRAFAVGRTHVTRGQFAAFVAATGHKTDGGCHGVDGKEQKWKLDAARNWQSPGFEQDDRHTVVCVNWYDAQAYAAWMKQATGHDYRLLTEAEAEYATRGTTRTSRQPRYSFGNDTKQLCKHGNGADLLSAACEDGYATTAPVASFAANSFGLHDVHGNAWSWVQDCFIDSYKDAPKDGRAAAESTTCPRVLRGGSWGGVPRNLRSAVRDSSPPDNRSYLNGFRLARTLNP